MIDVLKKKKTHILILKKVRQGHLDKESLILIDIQKKIFSAQEDLKIIQKKYFDSIENLNQALLLQNSWNQEIESRGSGFYKQQWLDTLKKVKDLEKKYQIQISQVSEAQNKLKAVEKFEENIEKKIYEERIRKEQSFLDDLCNGARNL